MFDSKNDLRRFAHVDRVKPANMPKLILTVRELYRRQNGKCFYCFLELEPTPRNGIIVNGWTRDHFFPAVAGNPLEGNMVLACHTCNQGKSNYRPTNKEINRFRRLYAGDNLQCIFGRGACK